MMRHYEDHHPSLVLPELFKVSEKEASKLFKAQLHMSDPKICYQSQCPPVPAGDGMSRWTWHILHKSLQVRKFLVDDGDPHPACA